MPPKKYVPPPDLSTKYPTAPATKADEIPAEVLAVGEAVVLEESPYAKTLRLPSGTIRRDKLQATDAELAESKRVEKIRKAQRCEALGSCRADDEPEPERPAGFQKPGDPNTKKVDH